MGNSSIARFRRKGLFMDRKTQEKTKHCAHRSKSLNVRLLLQAFPHDFWLQAPKYEEIPTVGLGLLNDYPQFRIFFELFFEPQKHKIHAFEPSEMGISDISKSDWKMITFPVVIDHQLLAIFRFDWQDQSWYWLDRKKLAWIKDTGNRLEKHLKNDWEIFRKEKQQQALEALESYNKENNKNNALPEEFIESEKNKRKLKRINVKLELLSEITKLTDQLLWEKETLQGLSPFSNIKEIDGIRDRVFNACQVSGRTLAGLFIPCDEKY